MASKSVGTLNKWEKIMGILVVSLFLTSSVIVSRTVQALNQAAGSYGYYGGSYGFNSDTTSDAPPEVPGTLTASDVSTTSLVLNWSAPTTTTLGTAIATGSGSISSYNINYRTGSSLSACSGGTSTTSTSTSKTITDLTSNTTYYFAVCAVDNNTNAGSAQTGNFTTSSGGGSAGSGGGGGGGSSVYSGTPAPAAAAPAAAAPVATAPSVVGDGAALAAALGVARDTAAEQQAVVKIDASVKEFKVTLGATDKVIVSNFVAYGVDNATQKLGSGERLAVVRDQLETLGRVSLQALVQIANGQKPTDRNLAKERAQVKVAQAIYRKLVGRDPNFKVVKEDLAWNTMMYRIRFSRDLNKEKQGIAKFKQIEKRVPKSPFDWAVVRAWGYQLNQK